MPKDRYHSLDNLNPADMKWISFLFLLTISVVRPLKAQVVYVDPTTAAAMALHSAVINGQLGTTNQKLGLIQSTQLTVTSQLAIANSIQLQIYRGLSEVSSVMNSLLALKDITDISSDIFSDINKAADLVKTAPALAVFAAQGAGEFKTRAIALGTEVSTFILQGGEKNLMDSGERAKLLHRMVDELMIIRGVAYGLYRTMFWARQRGLLNALNPYAGFINIDTRIGDDIIGNTKYLKP
jgi:hypothetical protein